MPAGPHTPRPDERQPHPLAYNRGVLTGVDNPNALSVVIPTRDRHAVLQHTLDALERQVDAPPFEVVVVDDGSRDDTLRMLDARRPEGFTLRVERQERLGPATARNRGVAAARAARILLLGDDTWPEPETLALHGTLGGDNRRGVQGRIDWDPELEVTPVMAFLAPSGPQFYFDGLREGEPIDYTGVLGSNFSAPRAWFVQEPFDEGFPHACFEDTELAFRWRRLGWTSIFSQRARCWHRHRYDALTPFLARQHRAGIAARHAVGRHPSMLGRVVAQPAAVGAWHALRALGRRWRHGSSQPQDDWDLACRWAFLKGFLTKSAGPAEPGLPAPNPLRPSSIDSGRPGIGDP